jgi:hypothetical protein
MSGAFKGFRREHWTELKPNDFRPEYTFRIGGTMIVDQSLN